MLTNVVGSPVGCVAIILDWGRRCWLGCILAACLAGFEPEPAAKADQQCDKYSAH